MGLPSLRQTDGLEVFFARDPAVLAVDFGVDPNLAGIRYPEIDIVLVDAPRNKSLRFASSPTTRRSECGWGNGPRIFSCP